MVVGMMDLKLAVAPSKAGIDKLFRRCRTGSTLGSSTNSLDGGRGGSLYSNFSIAGMDVFVALTGYRYAIVTNWKVDAGLRNSNVVVYRLIMWMIF